MPTFPFPAYEPDRTGLRASNMIKNVLPTQDGYRPFPGLAVYSDPLDDPCRGGIMARNINGSITVFAGTADAIYKLTTTTWEDVTGASGPYGLADGDNWSFTQFGDNVIAVNVNDPPQIFNLTGDTDFSDLGGSPPLSRYVGSSGDYLVLLSTAAEPGRFSRSGVNDPAFWTPKQRGSDFQDLPTDGGMIVGMANGPGSAPIFAQKSIHLLQDQPGSALLFTIPEVETGRSAAAPQGIVQSGNVICFLAEDGFYRYGAPQSQPIGAERVDSTFLSTVDLDKITEVQGAADPANKLIAWLYTTGSGTKEILVYNWQLDRWSQADTAATYLLTAATPGFTLEELESSLGYTNIDTMPFSLDSRALRGGRPTFGAFNADNELCFYNGPNMEATVETNDAPIGGDGRRAFVNGFRPVGEVSGAYGRVGTKATFGDSVSWGAESAQGSATGLIPARADGRTLRFRVRVPAATDWNHIVGVEVPPESARATGRR